MRTSGNTTGAWQDLLSDVVHLKRQEVFVGIDDTAELEQLFRLVNSSSGAYNFSQTTALHLITSYIRAMYTLRRPSTIALLTLYVPVFLLSLLGNGLVVLVVGRHAHLRRAKNLFLVNLALSDLLVTLICMPLVVGEIVFRLWIYGEPMCKITGFMQGLSVSASIFTLVALSIDRYLALKLPSKGSRMPGAWPAMCLLVLVWLLSAAFMVPVLMVRQVERVSFDSLQISLAYCVERWWRQQSRQAYGVFLLGATYVIPIIIISTCYALIGQTLCVRDFHRDLPEMSSSVLAGRKRVARMLVVIIVVFVLCWLPYNICSLSLDLKSDMRDTGFLPFTLWIGHAHSAINPFLYWTLNKPFRTVMRRAMHCHWQRRDNKDIVNPQPCNSVGGGDVLHMTSPPHPPAPLSAPGHRSRALFMAPGVSRCSMSSSSQRDSPEGESGGQQGMLSLPTGSTSLPITGSVATAAETSQQSACSLVVHVSRTDSRMSISTESMKSTAYITADGEIVV